ncbi:MAG: hypothetical protein ABIL09_12980 [Gemmatimonadota bacterium]
MNGRKKGTKVGWQNPTIDAAKVREVSERLGFPTPPAMFRALYLGPRWTQAIRKPDKMVVNGHLLLCMELILEALDTYDERLVRTFIVTARDGTELIKALVAAVITELDTAPLNYVRARGQLQGRER